MADLEGSEAPEGVTLTRAEHDRLQAEVRLATKERKEREAREAAETARREREAADAQALRDQLNERDRRDTLRDEITARQLTPSQARLVLQLADFSDPGFAAQAAVDAIVGDYPDIFAAPAAPPEPTLPTPPPVRRAGPAPQQPQRTSPFEGYISPDEYNRYPQAVRLSPEFQKRVEASKPYWPTHFNPKAFPQS